MNIPSDGPYYDDLAVGLEFETPPAVTVDTGLAAAYRGIVGDALPLGLSAPLAEAVTGSATPIASPGLVMHLSIGASTVATKRVIANLFYKGLRLHRPVRLGETLRTTTRVLALADGSAKPGHARGKVLLGIRTEADGEVVLNYQRCPLVRLRGDELPGHHDEIAGPPDEVDLSVFSPGVPEWSLDLLGPTDPWQPGETRTDQFRDVVDQATTLVRLTHNLAAVHRDVAASPYEERLVYGGHTVALAESSLSRVMGGLATIVGWHGCDHVAPVFEQDLLSFSHTLTEQRQISGGTLRALRVVASAHRGDGEPVEVLHWTPVVYTT